MVNRREKNMERMSIRVLYEEPRRYTKFEQLLFFITRPLAKWMQSLNEEKSKQISKRRRMLAELNKRDYILAVAQILYDEVEALGGTNNRNLQKMLCIDEAREIFNERKQSGGFDDLNIMI